MKKVIILTFAAICLIALHSAAQAQSKQQVRFAKGSNSTLITGRIVNGKQVIYLISARKGQILQFDIAENSVNNDVVGEVFAPDGRNLSGEDYGKEWQGKLPQTGVYKITVGTIESENADFKIRITVR